MRPPSIQHNITVGVEVWDGFGVEVGITVSCGNKGDGVWLGGILGEGEATGDAVGEIGALKFTGSTVF
jgi:hypothetical protein